MRDTEASGWLGQRIAAGSRAWLGAPFLPCRTVSDLDSFGFPELFDVVPGEAEFEQQFFCVLSVLWWWQCFAGDLVVHRDEATGNGDVASGGMLHGTDVAVGFGLLAGEHGAVVDDLCREDVGLLEDGEPFFGGAQTEYGFGFGAEGFAVRLSAASVDEAGVVLEVLDAEDPEASEASKHGGDRLQQVKVGLGAGSNGVMEVHRAQVDTTAAHRADPSKGEATVRRRGHLASSDRHGHADMPTRADSHSG